MINFLLGVFDKTLERLRFNRPQRILRRATRCKRIMDLGNVVANVTMQVRNPNLHRPGTWMLLSQYIETQLPMFSNYSVASLHLMFGEKSHHGFPSGHTTTAFLIATLLVLILRRRVVTWTGYAIASLVGLSTLYVGAHLPLDVAAGALVGTIAALWGFRLVMLSVPRPRAQG